MNQLDALQQAIPVADEVTTLQFLLHLLIGLALSTTLAWVYVRCGQSLSNRRKFAGNFFAITACTLVIITLIKSSLALSLGLVGALSIVRFRAAIKEPEELTYLFIAIMVGLGLGASQVTITVTAFTFIVGALMARHLIRPRPAAFDNLYVNIRHREAPADDLVGRVTAILDKYCGLVDLRRFDASATFSEAAFLVEVTEAKTLDEMVRELQALGPSFNVTLVDNRGLA